jgi:hypothetical protein
MAISLPKQQLVHGDIAWISLLPSGIGHLRALLQAPPYADCCLFVYVHLIPLLFNKLVDASPPSSTTLLDIPSLQGPANLRTAFRDGRDLTTLPPARIT